jgi:flagellar hook protein FlgE
MSIYKAMWTGVSGLAAEGQALGVVGDNIANSNTLGFKMSRAMFEDVLGGAVGQNVGGGVRMNRAQQIFSQGTMINTGQPTDVALTGEGFFVVKGSMDGVTGDFFTRAGNFMPDANGFLVSPQGLRVQGYGVNPDGTIGSTLGDIQFPTGPLPPKASTSFELDGSLDANATTPAAGAFNVADPANTSNFSKTMTVYDSLGNTHDLTVYFSKSPAPATNEWTYNVTVEGTEVGQPTPGPFEIGSGTLTFDTNGALDTSVVGVPIAPSFTGAAPSQAIDLDFGTSIAAGGTGLDGITQPAGASSVSASGDGYASGTLSGVRIESDGQVMGVYSNGEDMALAQLAVAKFATNDGLGRAGHNSWIATRKSGEAMIGKAGEGGRAAVVSGALEQSNVDIAGQFVSMISHQRAFQANSKTITTADEMLQEVVNLKR